MSRTLSILVLIAFTAPVFAERPAPEHRSLRGLLAARDRLEARVQARLDGSRFLGSTAFRRNEREVLSKATSSLLHPATSLKKVGAWAKQRATKGGKLVVWVARHPGESAQAMKKGANKAIRWAKNNPKKALMWGVGLPAVLVVALPSGVAEMVAVGVTNALMAQGATPTIAAIVGTGSGGALASGASSAWAHSLSMVNGSDKPNAKRVIQDAGMSAVFGFFGFGVAQGMKSGAQALGLTGAALKGYSWTGLMAFEMGKDWVQNGVNNVNIKVHKYHQGNKDKRLSKVLRALRINGVEDKDGSAKKWGEIWDSTLALETATNTPRIFGNLTTNFAVKSIIDMGARVVWDRILHGHAQKRAQQSVEKTFK